MFDRRWHQGGWYNYDLNGTGNYNMATVGDILQAVRNTGSASCEYNLGPSADPTNFIRIVNIIQNQLMEAWSVHRTANSDNVLTTYMDPVWFGLACQWDFNNLTGQKLMMDMKFILPVTKLVVLLEKAAGLGDIETVEEVPPIEIGNLIWEIQIGMVFRIQTNQGSRT